MTYKEVALALALAVATDWHKASYSNGDASGCVEVGTTPGFVGVRDTKLGSASPILAFTDVEWSAFTAGVKGGELDHSTATRPEAIPTRP